MARKYGKSDIDYPPIMDAKTAADFLDIGIDTFKEMFSVVKFKDFPRVYVKSDQRFLRDSIIVWLSNNQERLPQEKW